MGKRGTATLALLFAAGFCAYGCNHGSMIYVPLAVVSFGGDLFQAGLQATVFLAVAVALRFWFGPLADRRGPKPLMLAGMAAYTVATPLLGLCDTFPLVLAVRCVQAVGMAAFFPCALSAVSEAAFQRRSGLTLGLYRLVSSVALMVSAAALFPLVQAVGYGGSFAALGGLAAVGFLCVLAAPVARPCGEAEGSAAEGKASGAGLLASLRHILAMHSHLAVGVLGATFVAALGYGLISSFATPFVEQAAPAANAGLLMALVGAGGLAANPVAGWLVDRYPSLGVLVGFGVCLGVGTGLLALVPGVSALLPVAGLVLGIGYFGTVTSAVALIAKSVAPAGRSSFIAMQQNCIDAGAGLSGIFFGALFSLINPALVFALWGVVTTGAALGLAVGNGRRRE